MNKVVVTGATGLMGSNLLTLLAKKFEVHAISRSHRNPEIENVKWYNADLSSDIHISALPKKIETVVYLAQSANFREFPEKALDIFEINTVKLLEMLNYARLSGAKRFIYASSGGVYDSGKLGLSEDQVLPANGHAGFYSSSKLCSEILTDTYTPFMDVIVLRFFFVYGKRQNKSMLIPRLVNNVMSCNPIILQGKNGLLFNPIHVSDAVLSILAASALTGSHKINVAGSEVVSLRQICEMIGKKIGIEPIFEDDPEIAPKILVGDIDKMKRLLTTPRCFLDEGLSEMIDANRIF